MPSDLVGKGGFEPPASASRTLRANQAALLPVPSPMLTEGRPGGVFETAANRGTVEALATLSPFGPTPLPPLRACGATASALRRQHVRHPRRQRPVVVPPPASSAVTAALIRSGSRGLTSQPATAVRLAKNVSARRSSSTSIGTGFSRRPAAGFERCLHGHCQPTHRADLEVSDHQVGYALL